MPGKVENPWNPPLEPSIPTRKRKQDGVDARDKLRPKVLPRHQPSLVHNPLQPSTTPIITTNAPVDDTSTIPEELGKLVSRDVELLQRLGWKQFVLQRRRRGDFNTFHNLPHPAKRLLHHYKHHGVPVSTKSSQWTGDQLLKALQRGPHRSCMEYKDFLCEEFCDMIRKEQWVVLPFDTVKDLPGLRLSPPGVVPQRERRPRWIGDYTWSGVNDDCNPLAPLEAMQFGQALQRLLRTILLADPQHGPVQIMKVDISDGFYRVNLRIGDIPKLALVFPSIDGSPPLVALPLVLPMGWSYSPAPFSAATETITDMANMKQRNLHRIPTSSPFHKFDQRAQDIAVDPPPPLHHSAQTLLPDPLIPYSSHPIAYSDVYVDDLINICQGNLERLRRARSVIFDSIDDVFRPLDTLDSTYRREPISLKKLDKGDCTWSTFKEVLGWLLDTVNHTITLPPHRVTKLYAILDSIPPSQKRLSVKKWHKILGELRSMSIALPGSRGLFSALQLALQTQKGQRIALHKGVHAFLHDFRWLADDITHRPTRMQEIIPLAPSITAYHDASGTMAGGVVIPHATVSHRHPSAAPVIWRHTFGSDISSRLVSDDNPHGDITNSDLELAGNLLSNDCIVHNFDVQERTTLSKTDNTPTLFWLRKGSVTTNGPASHLLRAAAIHQRFHRYVPLIDYVKGQLNTISDIPSRSNHLTNSQLLAYFNTNFPQPKPWRIWTHPNETITAVTSCLLRKTFNMELLHHDLPKPVPNGSIGNVSVQHWPSTLVFNKSKIPSLSSKSMHDGTDVENFPSSGSQSNHVQLKMPYARLAKRSPVWGPRTHARISRGR